MLAGRSPALALAGGGATALSAAAHPESMSSAVARVRLGERMPHDDDGHPHGAD